MGTVLMCDDHAGTAQTFFYCSSVAVRPSTVYFAFESCMDTLRF